MPVVAMLAGCIEPAVSMKPFTFQEKAVTVRDWDTVAKRIATEMQARNLLGAESSGLPSLFYVNMVTKGSTFLNEVHDALESEIGVRGGSVARSPTGATVINLDARFVQWGRLDAGPGGIGTVLGVGTASGLLIADGGNPNPTLIGQAGIALGAGILFDVLAATWQTTNAEVVWQALIVSGDRVLLRMQKPMYVTPSDFPLYQGRLAGSMASPGPTIALEAIRLRYQQ